MITITDFYETLDHIQTLTHPDADLAYITNEHAPLSNLLLDYEGCSRCLEPFGLSESTRLTELAEVFTVHAEELAKRCGVNIENIRAAHDKGLIPLFAGYENQSNVDTNVYVLCTHEEYAVRDLIWLSDGLRAHAGRCCLGGSK